MSGTSSKDKGRRQNPLTVEHKVTNIFRLGELVPMALQAVEFSSTSKKVPLRVLDSLRRAISARKACSWLYRLQNDPSQRASNLGHLHFNGVLEEVDSILRPHAVKSS